MVGVSVSGSGVFESEDRHLGVAPAPQPDQNTEEQVQFGALCNGTLDR